MSDHDPGPVPHGDTDPLEAHLCELDVFQLAAIATEATAVALAFRHFATRLEALPEVRTTPGRMAATVRDLAEQYDTLSAEAHQKAGL